MLQEEQNLYSARKARVFLLLAGIFLGTLTMLNTLGVSRFINFGDIHLFGYTFPFAVAVGVLPYPITFLCTDLISELYGRKKANQVVWTGLILNLWVLFILWLGGNLDAPALGSDGLPLVENNEVPYEYSFYFIRKLTFGAVIASMLAYLFAQLIDVHVFHWLKEKTKGEKLWLRNNASTMLSQMVDSVCVIVITYYATDGGLPIQDGYTVVEGLMVYIISSYLFKVAAALLDTLPFYLGVRYLKRYFGEA